MTKVLKIEIMGHAPCPNCNATADVIARKRGPQMPWWEILCRCSKCKGEWPYVDHVMLDFEECVIKANIGPLMHDLLKRNIDARKALHAQWQKATTPAQRGRIMAAVRKLGEEEKEWNASL